MTSGPRDVNTPTRPESLNMTWHLVAILAKEVMDRPNAHMAAIEMLDMDHDGFDGVRVELFDAPLCLSGVRKGKPNWRKSTNRQRRLISTADLNAAAVAWSERTGLCIECTGTGQRFLRWDINEGTTWGACPPCAGSGASVGGGCND